MSRCKHSNNLKIFFNFFTWHILIISFLLSQLFPGPPTSLFTQLHSLCLCLSLPLSLSPKQKSKQRKKKRKQKRFSKISKQNQKHTQINMVSVLRWPSTPGMDHGVRLRDPVVLHWRKPISSFSESVSCKGLCVPFPFSVLEFCLVWMCASLVYVAIVSVSSQVISF